MSEHGPVNQRVAGLIPGQGTYLGCARSLVGGVGGATDRCFSHTSMFPFLPLSLKINKNKFKKKEKIR